MTNDDITRLKEAAEKATPGPWHESHKNAERDEKAVLAYSGAAIALVAIDEDVDFIALANPSAILSLLQRLRKAEEALTKKKSTQP